MTEKTLPWIQAGYTLFAKEGPQALKVEVMSRLVGKNKSSFYHHFADLEIYTSALLDYHLQRAKAVLKEEAACKTVDPELLQVLIKNKEDLLFNRQLRIHRHIPEMAACFARTVDGMGEAIGGIWAEMLGLEDNSRLALMVLNLSLENFYLQITEETLNLEWLQAYVYHLKSMANEFEQTAQRKIHNER